MSCRRQAGAATAADARTARAQPVAAHVPLAPNQSQPPRLQVLELVSKLQTSSGRAALVDMYGAKHECADDAEMANDDDDVDASRCVPPAGTKVALCELAAHTVMNEQSGAIVGYSAEADRYVVQLEDGTRVRVCRGNLRLEALTTHDFAHAIGETCTVFSRLAARHGASMTSELVGALLQLPNREWTVMKDLVAVDYAWAARTQEGDSLHSLGAPPSHKAQKTNSTSYMRLQHRLHVLRATLPPKLAEEFLILEVSAAAAPFRAAARIRPPDRPRCWRTRPTSSSVRAHVHSKLHRRLVSAAATSCLHSDRVAAAACAMAVLPGKAVHLVDLRGVTTSLATAHSLSDETCSLHPSSSRLPPLRAGK